MSKGKVLIAAPVHPVLTEGLEEEGYEVFIKEKIIQAEAYEIVKDCVGIVTSTRLLLDKELIDAAPALRWIGRMGSGMEIIDTAYTAKKNIACYSSPEGNCNAVAEHALGMLLSLTKRITWANDEVKQGKWLREENRGIELEGKTIGIIGFGHTGRAFARKLQGFDVEILAYDKNRGLVYPDYVTQANIQDIENNADVISFHVPLEKETYHYFNERFVSRVKKPFILLNTSRGGVVDISMVWKGLQNGKIAGAGLDVLEDEPLNIMSASNRKLLEEMMAWPQVLITPHIAGYTKEALHKMSAVLLAKIVTVRSNET